MDLSGDDLAGVVDLFGGLTRPELDRAVEELTFKRDADHDPEAVETAVDRALDRYHLVAVGEDPTLLASGPAAFPTLPDGATDLPHIMDVPDRSVDRETAARAALERLEQDAEAAVEDDDQWAAGRLVDVSYDLESWSGVDASAVRERLDEV